MRRALLILGVILTGATACTWGQEEKNHCSCGADHLVPGHGSGSSTYGSPPWRTTTMTVRIGGDQKIVVGQPDPFTFEVESAFPDTDGGVDGGDGGEDGGALPEDAGADAGPEDAATTADADAADGGDAGDADAGDGGAPSHVVAMVRLRTKPAGGPPPVVGVYDLADIGGEVWTCDAPGVLHGDATGFSCSPAATRRTLALVGELEVTQSATYGVHYRVDGQTRPDPKQPVLTISGTVLDEPDTRVDQPYPASEATHDCY